MTANTIYGKMIISLNSRINVVYGQKQTPPPPVQPALRSSLWIGPHWLPGHWQPLDWLITWLGNQVYIHHGHTDPTDHSACGPLLLCCLRAVQKYQRLPGSPLAEQGEWQLINGAELTPFLERGGRMIYFIFCDPVRPEGLWAIGLEGEALQQILFKQQPLEQLLSFPTVKRLA